MKKLLISFAILLLPVAGSAQDYCFREAGETYNISPDLLWAIAKNESNFNPNALNWNKNGTLDVGVMQINSSWYSTLGEDRWMALGDPCTNIMTGAWILSQCISRAGYTWQAVGCYNTGSPKKGAAYINRVAKILEKYSR